MNRRIRYSNCPCPGTWKDKLARWVCLRRFRDGGFLKCQACGWKWKSKRKYVSRLKDHEERCVSGLTDRDVLARLKNGSLTIDPETAEVVSITNKGRRILSQRKSNQDDGYRFVDVWRFGKKKRIAVHRLQWMAHTMSLIPKGYDVHHKRSPPRPHTKPNNLANLELVESMENQKVGVSPGWDAEVPF